nr:hypothetical protein [Tanacetum cinerariifolium]
KLAVERLQGLIKDLTQQARYKEKAMLAEAYEAGQILDEEQLVFLADPGIPAEVPNSKTYLNDMDNQSVHALQDFEQSPVMDFTDNEKSIDINIISYSQYLQETQQATVQDTNFQAQQVGVPSKLPKVSLVNASLKKLKFHLTKFDSVVKKRITPNALEDDEWGFELTRTVFNNEIILFLKSLKDIFNVFDKDLLNEIMERIKAKNNKISQPSSSNKINKVEEQPRSIKTRKNKKNHVKKVKWDDHLMQSMSNANSIFVSINNAPVKNSVNDVKSGCLCAICGKCMISKTHYECVHVVVSKLNLSKKSKSTKKHKTQYVWKPTGYVFTKVGLKWKPTGRTFTIVGNSYPLTRFTLTNVVPPKQPTSHSDEIQKPKIKVYSRKPKNCKNIGLSKMAKIVESKKFNHVVIDIPSSSSFVMTGTVRFGNNQIARIMGYGDYQLGNVIISRVYYVEGLGHNLFSVGHFCDADLEVAFRKNTCFIRHLEGVDLLSGSRDTNLYTISLDDMLKSSLICVLSKASETKSWLWHRQLSHLNFACALGKNKKSSDQPKAEDTNQKKLYLLHIDLCGLMHVASINEKRYILVIVDDYSRFTWVKFLKTKDEAPAAVIKCIKNIQVCLNATVRNVRIDNGTEFDNQTLREFYENVGISHQTFIAHTPQQNGVVERRNWTLVEAA